PRSWHRPHGRARYNLSAEWLLPGPRREEFIRHRRWRLRHQRRQESDAYDHGADVACVRLFARPGKEGKSVRNPTMSISRRDILKSLGISAVTGSVLRVIPLQAAEYAHHM